MVEEQKISPAVYSLPPLEYLGLVEIINENTVKNYRDILGSLTLGGEECIVMVGSDGKKERHSQSKTEVVLIQGERAIYDSAEAITYALAVKNYPITYQLNPSGNIEAKNLNEFIPISFAYQDRNRVYPDRILNSTFIAGNREIATKARESVLKEMSADNPESRRIRRKMEDQLRSYKSSAKTGIVRNSIVFSLEKGEQYYTEKETLIFGFKLPFLRTVQRKLDIQTARLIRKINLDIKNLASELPVRTVDRLQFFSDLGIISQEFTEEICISYSWFLREYHKTQETYKNNRAHVAIGFNRKEFETHSRTILAFSKTKI